MTTYSQSLTGTRLDYLPNQPSKLLDVPDADAAGNCLATIPSQGQAMRLGNQVLCQNPDGSQSWYRISATESRTGQLVLYKVAP